MGLDLCIPRIFISSSEVSSKGTNSSSCTKSSRRHSRDHLASVRIPAILKLSGTNRDVGKRPNGMSPSLKALV